MNWLLALLLQLACKLFLLTFVFELLLLLLLLQLSLLTFVFELLLLLLLLLLLQLSLLSLLDDDWVQGALCLVCFDFVSSTRCLTILTQRSQVSMFISNLHSCVN